VKYYEVAAKRRRLDQTPVDIYALLDDEERVRYVGQSTDVEKRLRSHWSTRTAHGYVVNKRLVAWLKTLVEPPTVRVLTTVPRGVSFQVEREQTLKAIGEYGDLVCNKRAGGSHLISS
jgi:hypothetical protein